MSSPKSTSKTSSRFDLRGLLTIKLQALLDVETQLVKAIPKMAQKSSDPALKQSFEKHGGQTRDHIERLKRCFDLLGLKAKKVKVEAIRGLIADAEWTMKAIKDPAVRDAGMIAGAQYVEHYEMAGYGTATEWARLLGEGEVSGLLQQTLQEEKDADAGLNELAQSQINEKASSS